MLVLLLTLLSACAIVIPLRTSAGPDGEDMPSVSSSPQIGQPSTGNTVGAPNTSLSDPSSADPVTDPGTYTGQQTSPVTGGDLPNTTAPVTVTEPVSTTVIPEIPEPVHAVKMDVSEPGLDLIKSFEGFYSAPYWDYSHWSIGYGSYVCPEGDDPYEIYPNGISMAEADELLHQKIGVYLNGLNNFLLEYDLPMTQNQFDALLSFTYNLGQNIWKRSTDSFTLKRLLISGDYTDEDITEAFYMWRHAGGKENAGLAKRRLREARLFCSEIDMGDPTTQGYTVDYYIVNTKYLTVRDGASTSADSLGSIRKDTVIPVIQYDNGGKWGFTTYAAYFGWVSVDYLIPVLEQAKVTVLDEYYKDDQGVTYTVDNINKTASVGIIGQDNNGSGYEGQNNGYVFLTKYVLINRDVYTVTGINDGAFKNNDQLYKIYIPSSVETIGNNAFTGSALKDIYYEIGSYAQKYAEKSQYNATDYRCVNSHTFGKWTTVHQGDSTIARTDQCVCEVCGYILSRRAVSIELTSLPDKLEYVEGQKFSPAGIKVMLNLSDGTKVDVTSSAVVGDFDSSLLGEKTVSVTYSVFETSFKAKVNEKELIGIIISKTPSTTTYIEGTDLDTKGLAVTAIYTDNIRESVKEYSVSGYDMNAIGKQVITVSYSGFTASFSVTVKAKTVTSISILSEPYKTEYYCGEKFDPEGIMIRLKYDNGTTAVVSEGFTVKHFDSSEPETSQKVRIYYGSKLYKNITVTIIQNKLKTDYYTVRNDVIYGLDVKTKVSEFLSHFEESERITVYDKNGKSLKKNDYIGDDSTAVLWYNADKLDTIRIEITGDINGDGMLSLTDYFRLRDYFISEDEPAYLETLDINKDGKITLTDLVKLAERLDLKGTE